MYDSMFLHLVDSTNFHWRHVGDAQAFSLLRAIILCYRPLLLHIYNCLRISIFIQPKKDYFICCEKIKNEGKMGNRDGTVSNVTSSKIYLYQVNDTSLTWVLNEMIFHCDIGYCLLSSFDIPKKNDFQIVFQYWVLVLYQQIIVKIWSIFQNAEQCLCAYTVGFITVCPWHRMQFKTFLITSTFSWGFA